MTQTNMPDMPPIERLHHWAIRCRDAEETRHFYEDILGLPLVHVIKLDNVPTVLQVVIQLEQSRFSVD